MLLISQRVDELAFLIANKGGKPLIDARIAVSIAIDGAELYAKEISNLTGS
ncbi:MAG: acyl-CoA reductase-like NAD-dependent aldehyde dehydrogenase [Colwellia sp.]